jgi:hypothetical protein
MYQSFHLGFFEMTHLSLDIDLVKVKDGSELL